MKEIRIRKNTDDFFDNTVRHGYVVHVGTGQGGMDYDTYGPFETKEEAEAKAEELRQSDEGYEY
jgi:hypothetical protein